MSDNKKITIEVKFWGIDNPIVAHASHTLSGRLLGILSSNEAAGLLSSYKAADKLFTKPTISLSSAIDAMEELNKSKNADNFGHLLVAVKMLGKNDSWAKRLCVTASVDLLDQTKLDSATGLVELDASLSDGTIISIKESVKNG